MSDPYTLADLIREFTPRWSFARSALEFGLPISNNTFAVRLNGHTKRGQPIIVEIGTATPEALAARMRLIEEEFHEQQNP